MHKNVRRAAVIGSVLAVTTGAGVAYAAWNVNGTGAATAKATTVERLVTMDAAATTTADLYPGASGAVEVKIKNPNLFPVRITRVVADPDRGITAREGTGKGTCTVTGVAFTNQVNLELDIPAEGFVRFALVDAVRMTNDSDNGCQGATFDIPVRLVGASNAS
jgi:hypothetical protein